MPKSSSFSLNIADFYIILWCIYMHQGAIAPSGGIVFQALLLVLLLMSVYFAIRVISKYTTPPYFKGLSLFLGVLSLYGLLHFICGETLVIREIGSSVPRFNYLKLLLSSLLPIYAFYYFGRQGYITDRKLCIYSIVFVILSIYSFFLFQAQTLAERDSAEAFEITNNVGYAFIAIIPLLALIKNNLLKSILFAICVTFSLLSIKRGAIIVGGVATIIFLVYLLKQGHKGTKIVIFLSVVGLGLGVYYLASDMIQNNAYFQLRLERTLSGESSTRDIIYSSLWNHFLNESSVINQLFGNGAFATTKFSMNYAHNDWLEILIDHGLFGIVLYILYWFLFLKTWLASREKCNDGIITAFFLVMVIYFLKTFFSMSYFDMTIYATLPLGYCLSQMNDNGPKYTSL